MPLRWLERCACSGTIPYGHRVLWLPGRVRLETQSQQLHPDSFILVSIFQVSFIYIESS